MDNVDNFEDYKSEKDKGSVSKNQKKKKMRRYVKGLKYIVDLYNIKSGSDTSKKDSDTSKKDSDTSKKGEGLKILSNKQMLNHFPILLAQI